MEGHNADVMPMLVMSSEKMVEEMVGHSFDKFTTTWKKPVQKIVREPSRCSCPRFGMAEAVQQRAGYATCNGHYASTNKLQENWSFTAAWRDARQLAVADER